MDDEYQRQIWRWCRDQEILERQKERLAIERGKPDEEAYAVGDLPCAVDVVEGMEQS